MPPPIKTCEPALTTPLGEQACISRSARGAVWGVLTCLFVLSRYKGPKIFFACGALRIPLEISKETVFSLQCFSFGPGAVLGGAYILIGLSCVTIFDCSVKSGLRIPHPTYKRSTRSTTNKDEEQSYSKNRGEERRQEAPAYSTKCLSRW